jgi:formylglycine-generating enzyme required for sulfatase activity
MWRSIWGLCLVAGLIVAPLALAQSNLPPEARAQVLMVRAQNALARGNEAEALAALGEITTANLPRPPSTFVLEAQLAGRAKEYGRSRRALEAYFAAVKPDDAQYQMAAELYAALDEMERQEQARAATAAKAADDAAWARANAARTCANYAAYLMQARSPAAYGAEAVRGLEAQACALPQHSAISEAARTSAGAALTEAIARERARTDAAAQAADRARWDQVGAAGGCDALFTYYTTAPQPRGFLGQALERMRAQRCPNLPAAATPASTRAPVLARGATPQPFQLFRDCPDCPDMVVMPAGNFVMGSPATEAGRDANEGPQRAVSLPAFAIGRFEVTFDDWALCARERGCKSNRAPSDFGWGRGARPVINVNWSEVQEYVQWLSSKSGKTYRLLTEAEWEYAARAGTSTRWSFGDTESQLGAFAWFTSNSGGRTQPVGGKAPNPWGLFDMHGNVWEWVEDCYNNNYDLTPTNGAANTTGSCALRVIRGGAWDNDPQLLRSASRNWFTPAVRYSTIGFRLSRAL